MSNREIAETLYQMAMDMDWTDYEDVKDKAINKLESELENISGDFRWILERIAMPMAK